MQPTTDTQRFPIDRVIRRIRAAVRPFPKAALFELADEGFVSPFEQLTACVISIRTLDEVTLPTARQLFAVARTPDAMSRLTVEALDQLIGHCTFHRPKAKTLHAIARRVETEFDGHLPCDEKTLLSFGGVGPKCAALVRGIACGQPAISVDVHVHRITNRWGYVETTSPERTSAALAKQLQRHYWVEINRLLVPFGKHICTGRLPKCSTCPVRAMCRQVGVSTHR